MSLMVGWGRCWTALIVVILVGAWAAPVSAAVPGELTQARGRTGCVSQTGSHGLCARSRALNDPADAVVSPDGRNVYVASSFSDAVAVFDRNAATGRLTQKSGIAGCVSETGSGGLCADGTALDGSVSVAVSPDGRNVYVASVFSAAVAVLDRDASTGALTQKAGTAGCISRTGSGGLCARGRALDGNQGIVQRMAVKVSPEGQNVYVTSIGSSAVAVFDRNPVTGALSQKAGRAGCVSSYSGPATSCSHARAMVRPTSLTLSPDGRNLYVASDANSALAVFDRNAITGVLTQKQGTAGCVNGLAPGTSCAEGIAVDFAYSVAVSPDGSNVYLASSPGYNHFSGAVTIFDRNLSTGELTAKSGSAGCVLTLNERPICATGGVAFAFPVSLAVSADGLNVYVASLYGDSVAVFDRNSSTGALSQKSGRSACISQLVLPQICRRVHAIDGPFTVAVSPDGANAYVASSLDDAVAVFDRE